VAFCVFFSTIISYYLIYHILFQWVIYNKPLQLGFGLNSNFRLLRQSFQLFLPHISHLNLNHHTFLSKAFIQSYTKCEYLECNCSPSACNASPLRWNCSCMKGRASIFITKYLARLTDILFPPFRRSNALVKMFKKIFAAALLASSVGAFNGQAPAAFTQKHNSESALRMSGGSVVPDLKVNY